MSAVIHMGTGKLRCRNEHEGVRCPYRRDAHPGGGCPTRNKRLALAALRKEDRILRLDPEAAAAGAQMLELLKQGADLKQVVCTEPFMRFSIAVLRVVDKKKASKR